MEKKTFYIEIADLVVELKLQNDSLLGLYKKYLIEAPAVIDIKARALDDDMLNERRASGEEFSDVYYEDVCLHRSIAEQLPAFDRFVMHGASISVDGRGYIFTAPSGTGKSTHIKLWTDNLGDRARVINGDKPIIKKLDDGFEICSCPWAGKEHWSNNIRARVNGICFLTRGVENKITKISPKSAVVRAIRQIYIPQNAEAKDKTFTLLDELLTSVPLYLLECDMSKEAFVTSFEAMTGERFDK